MINTFVRKYSVLLIATFLLATVVSSTVSAVTFIPNSCADGKTYQTSEAKCISYTYGVTTEDARYANLLPTGELVYEHLFFTWRNINYAVYYGENLKLNLAARPTSGGIVTRVEVSDVYPKKYFFNESSGKLYGVDSLGDTYDINYLLGSQQLIGTFDVTGMSVDNTGTFMQAPNGELYLLPNRVVMTEFISKLTLAGTASLVNVPASTSNIGNFVMDASGNLYLSVKTADSGDPDFVSTVKFVKVDPTGAFTIYDTEYLQANTAYSLVHKISNTKFAITFYDSFGMSYPKYYLTDGLTSVTYEYSSLLTVSDYADISDIIFGSDAAAYFIEATVFPETSEAAYRLVKINENGEYTVLHTDLRGEVKRTEIMGFDSNSDLIVRRATESDPTFYYERVNFDILPVALKKLYFTFWNLKYGNYVTPTRMRIGDNISLKNYDPKKVQLLAISLYDYTKKGNQCYTRTWRNSTQIYIKTCSYLPKGRKYAYIFTFRDIASGVVVKKYFTFNTIRAGLVTY